jgi:aminoacrylate hydrolase
MATPNILFIPGLAGKAVFWSRQLDAFAPRFAPLACDLGARASVEALARDTLALLDAHHIERCHVVGHSTGGAIAQVIAARHPERVARLVLSATWCTPTAPFLAFFRLRKRVLTELGAEPYAVLAALTAWPDDWLERHPELLAAAAGPGEKQGLLARMDAILAFDGASELGRIRAPTRVVCAEDDRIVPVNHSKRIAAGIRGSELRLLPYGGHFPQVAASDSYNALLMEFLNE